MFRNDRGYRIVRPPDHARFFVGLARLRRGSDEHIPYSIQKVSRGAIPLYFEKPFRHGDPLAMLHQFQSGAALDADRQCQ